MDPALPIADALWVRNGKVMKAGSRKEILKEAGLSAVIDDLQRAVIVPGLGDAHLHLAGLGDALSMVDLGGVRSADALYARLQKEASKSRRGDWIVGRGWNEAEWTGSKEMPTRAKLDALFPSTPVYLSRADGHAAWVNEEALRRAGINSRTQDPDGGIVVRAGRKNEPTGILIDNAMELVARKLPKLTDAERVQRIKAALDQCAALGLTSIHDAGMDLATFTLLQQLDIANALPIHVYAMADGQGPDADAFLGRGVYRGRRLEMRAVKFVLDGALGSRGAALFAPYTDATDTSGHLVLHPQELMEKARLFMERGFQVAVHAIGDRANGLVLDALGYLEESTKTRAFRHRIEHAQVLRSEDIARMAQLGVIASMQPIHATSDMGWAVTRLGPERLLGAYAWKSIQDAGVPLAFGSDAPVERPSPLLGIYAARTRQDAKGKPDAGWFAAQRLSGEDALRAYTVGVAYAGHAEDRRGKLAPGMEADFTVLSVDPVDGSPPTLLTATVRRTVVGGQDSFRAAD